MEVLVIASTSFLVGLSGALMPGPLLTLDITEAARRGFWAGPLLTVGHGAVEGAVVVALVLGLGGLLSTPVVGAAIGIVGGLVLIWLAQGMVRGALFGELSLGSVSSSGGLRAGPAVAGALVSVSNPYWVVWWATVGVSYLAWSLAQGGVGLVAFFGGHIMADLSWYSLVAALIAGGRRLIRDGVYKGLLVACGIVLAGLGVYFVVDGVQAWMRL